MGTAFSAGYPRIGGGRQAPAYPSVKSEIEKIILSVSLNGSYH
jgi:hypothetical protein